MPKPERGLPKSFTIRVPEGPVALGDYLDEPAPKPAAAPPPPPPPPPPVVEPPPVPVVVQAVAVAPAPEPVPPPAATPVYYQPPPPPPPPAPRTNAAAPPRRQFNMSPETLRMLDDLVNHIRMHSAERDVRASEVVHALVLAAHEVQPYLDLTKVPARGKWGSATAAALPVALKDVFQEAIGRRQRRGA